MNRKAIAAELLKNRSNDSMDDHRAIATAIESGQSWESICTMLEFDRWPETYAWLKGKLDQAKTDIYIWTSAPESFDLGWAETVGKWTRRDGRPVRKVRIQGAAAEHQLRRYHDGGYLCAR